MKYEALPELDRAEAEKRLASSDISTLRRTAAALPSVGDTEWVRGRLEALAEHEDGWVAGNALLALAELVRHGRIPRDQIEDVRGFVERRGAERGDVSGKVFDALSDMENYLRNHPRSPRESAAAGATKDETP